MKKQLPEPPRTLSRELRRNLWWGTPAMVFATANLFLVLLATLFMFVLYEIPVGALWPASGETVKVTSEIVRKEVETLPSGGEVTFAVAPVKVNEVVIEARGYGPRAESCKEGETVEISVPKANPAGAWLVGFERYPVRPQTLVLLGLLFTLPGVVAAAYSIVAAAGKRDLLITGEESRGKQLRKIPLPRPLKDMALVRWEYSYPGGTGRFWTLQNRSLEKPALLVNERRAAVLSNLLAHPSVDGEGLASLSKLEKLFAGLNGAFLILSGVSLLAYVLL